MLIKQISKVDLSNYSENDGTLTVKAILTHAGSYKKPSGQAFKFDKHDMKVWANAYNEFCSKNDKLHWGSVAIEHRDTNANSVIGKILSPITLSTDNGIDCLVANLHITNKEAITNIRHKTWGMLSVGIDTKDPRNISEVSITADPVDERARILMSKGATYVTKFEMPKYFGLGAPVVEWFPSYLDGCDNNPHDLVKLSNNVVGLINGNIISSQKIIDNEDKLKKIDMIKTKLIKNGKYFIGEFNTEIVNNLINMSMESFDSQIRLYSKTTMNYNNTLNNNKVAIKEKEIIMNMSIEDVDFIEQRGIAAYNKKIKMSKDNDVDIIPSVEAILPQETNHLLCLMNNKDTVQLAEVLQDAIKLSNDGDYTNLKKLLSGEEYSEQEDTSVKLSKQDFVLKSDLVNVQNTIMKETAELKIEMSRNTELLHKQQILLNEMNEYNKLKEPINVNE